MVVWVAMLVLAFFESHEFKGPVRNHFIRGHVCRSAGAALDEVNLELIV